MYTTRFARYASQCSAPGTRHSRSRGFSEAAAMLRVCVIGNVGVVLAVDEQHRHLGEVRHCGQRVERVHVSAVEATREVGGNREDAAGDARVTVLQVRPHREHRRVGDHAGDRRVLRRHDRERGPEPEAVKQDRQPVAAVPRVGNRADHVAQLRGAEPRRGCRRIRRALGGRSSGPAGRGGHSRAAVRAVRGPGRSACPRSDAPAPPSPARLVIRGTSPRNARPSAAGNSASSRRSWRSPGSPSTRRRLVLVIDSATKKPSTRCPTATAIASTSPRSTSGPSTSVRPGDAALHPRAPAQIAT